MHTVGNPARVLGIALALGGGGSTRPIWHLTGCICGSATTITDQYFHPARRKTFSTAGDGDNGFKAVGNLRMFTQAAKFHLMLDGHSDRKSRHKSRGQGL